MINEIVGDLLTAKGTIVHCVNCQKRMNSGVAGAIKAKWPNVFEEYCEAIDRVAHRPQSLLGTVHYVSIHPGVVIANLFGQFSSGQEGLKYVSYDAIDEGFKELGTHLLGFDDMFLTINFPKLGSVQAGGHWPIIKEIIDFRLPDEHFTKNLWTLPKLVQ